MDDWDNPRPRKGQAVIDIVASALTELLPLFPSTYRLIGSEQSEHVGVVRLVMESDDIAVGQRILMTAEVKDAGSTRTIRIIPLG